MLLKIYIMLCPPMGSQKKKGISSWTKGFAFSIHGKILLIHSILPVLLSNVSSIYLHTWKSYLTYQERKMLLLVRDTFLRQNKLFVICLAQFYIKIPRASYMKRVTRITWKSIEKYSTKYVHEMCYCSSAKKNNKFQLLLSS